MVEQLPYVALGAKPPVEPLARFRYAPPLVRGSEVLMDQATLPFTCALSLTEGWHVLQAYCMVPACIVWLPRVGAPAPVDTLWHVPHAAWFVPTQEGAVLVPPVSEEPWQ